MIPANERVALLRHELEESGLQALVCGLPTNVLLLTGYWPVLGTAVAMVNRTGRVGLIAPEDERDLAERGWADEVHLLGPGSLSDPRDALGLLHGPLAQCLRGLELGSGTIGIETGPVTEPAPYVAFNLYGESLHDALRRALPAASFEPAEERLARLRAVLTPDERGRVRLACHVAGEAFAEGAARLRAGMTEAEVARGFRGQLATRGVAAPGVQRADGFVFCMSGLNSARAYGSHARSTARLVRKGDLVLVHCNSYVDGYWTDITRTYCLGSPPVRLREMYDAVLGARAAALATAGPGVEARAVDQAARDVLAARGLGAAFRHPAGHGVGFAAIDHNARPRLRPGSPDVLLPGMVCNIEPAVYLDDTGGLRHCDMVAVTDSGMELLTPFQATLDELTVGAR
ncbi:MAG TPA: Xaa-Pro peptidase family protein [Gemmatimonadales bacterium]|nr:Xaa-Pro peptidase family protein [Gemmatimonadales bacterium]